MTATSIDAKAFYEGLVAHRLIVPVGVQGAFGRGAVFEDVLEAMNRLITRTSSDDQAEVYTFPPVIDRSILERVDYMDSFPHLSGSVHSYFGKELKAREIGQRIRDKQPWGDLLGQTGVVMNPAACYPVYPSLAGELPEEGRVVTMTNWVYRHEPSPEPTRMQSFRVREFVRAADPDAVVAWRDAWLDRGLKLLLSLGLPARADVASDPFFGRGGRVLADGQKAQKLKFEVLVPVISESDPTAVCSFNYHQEHFGHVFGIKTPKGEVAHTACLGFGLERVVMALFQTHGFESEILVGRRAREALAVTEAAFAIAALDPATYAPSVLHADERVWVEKNCYVDVLIEVVHALGLEPLAVMPFVVAVDFEGDQWTFFKPPHGELWDLYGLDVQELNVWRPLLEHVERHVKDGKLVSTEADAFYLPDTAGTDYRRAHTKTTIVVNEIDVAARRLGYFHNAKYHALDGDDFAAIFRVDHAPDPTFLPLYAEIVRIDRVVRRSPADLAARSRALLAHHLGRRPKDNPVARFGARFARELPALAEQGLAHYHAWAFATLRQLGAAFELAALHARWLAAASSAPAFAAAAESFDAISGGCKTLILKIARAVNARRPLDASAIFAEMAAAWQRGIDLAAAAAESVEHPNVTETEKIRTILKEHGRLAGDVDKLGDDSDLYQAGMTSHASVNVMLALEGEFEVEFPDHMLKRSVFESISAMRAAIQELTQR